MRITAIKPIEAKHSLVKAIQTQLSEKYDIAMNKGKNSIDLTFMLKECAYHTNAYLLNPNCEIVHYCTYSKTHKKPCSKADNCLMDKDVECNYLKPYVYFQISGTEIPIHKNKFLNESDYMHINETLNVICDNLNVECTIRTSWIKIRDGTKNVWLKEYMRIRNIFLMEKLELPLTEPIKQIVFRDYDALDKMALDCGYISKGNDNAFSGWVPTMGDSTHSTEGALRELNEKIEDAQTKGLSVIVGFCQTGNFSIGYSLYIKETLSETNINSEFDLERLE